MNSRKSALQISIINAIGTILSFIFNILLGRKFGISWEMDCLFVGLTIFSIVGIFNSFLTSLFIPVFNEIKYKNEKDSFIFADVTIKWSAVSAIIITFALWISGDLIVRFIASGFSGENITLTLEISRILFVAFVFNSISNVIGCILNALYLFSLPAVTGLLHPILNISALFILTPIYGVKAIAISYIASNIFQTGILFIYFILKTPWRPTIKFYHNKIPSLIKQSSKMTLSVLIWSLRDIISRNIASHLAVGSVALFAYSEKLISILLQVSVSPISKVFYSKISEHITTNKWADVRELFNRVVRVNVALALFISSGIIVFLMPFLNILFLDSRFTVSDINTLFYLVLIMLTYFLILSYEIYLVQIVYAEKKSYIVGFNATLGVVVFFISTWLLSKLYSVYGIAIGITITQLTVCSLYYYFINKQLNTSFRDFVIKAGKGFIIAVFFAVVGTGARYLTNNDMMTLLFILPVWTIFYFAIAKSIMGEEMKFAKIKEV